MRLGQLSRKLDVDSSAIVKVLHEHFREVNNHPNVKILDEEVEFLTQKFQPVPVPTQAEAHSETKAADVEQPIAVEEAVKVSPQEKPAFVEALRPKVISLESEFDKRKQELETFKAEKPELEGLKVLGKIELPQPKPKAPKEDKKEKEPKPTETINERGARNRYDKKGGKRNSNRNPLEAERKRAEQKAKRQKEQELQRLKEQKKKHYEETVKAKVADKPKKKKNKKKFVQQQIGQTKTQSSQKTSKSTNPLARFWRWLNGGYDKFD